jgi:TfoX/Sxy family transcriptional regulator of competence genes
MPYNEQLSDRVREALGNTKNVEEKAMFGGLCFMVNDKMCIGIVKDEIMCRIDPDKYEAVLEMPGCRPMDFNGRIMKGFVFVDEHGMKKKNDFQYWVDLCLEYNPKARSSKKK